MMKRVQKETELLYACEECHFQYREREWAEKCQALSPTEAGVDDLAAEAETLDTNFDADVTQLDTELKGL